MKNLKRIFIILPLIIVLAGLLTVTATAQSQPRLVDRANILTAEEEAKLASTLDEVSNKYGQDVVIVTVTSTDGKGVIRYADEFYDENGYGLGAERSGIILLVCMSTREYEISAHGEALETFGEFDFTRLEWALKPELSDGEYYEAFDNFANRCKHIIKYENRLSPIWIAIALVIGAAVAGIVIWRMAAKHKNVKFQRSADTYMRRDTFRLDASRDIFLFSHISRTPRPKKSSSGGGGGGGRSRGGRSGRF